MREMEDEREKNNKEKEKTRMKKIQGWGSLWWLLHNYLKQGIFQVSWLPCCNWKWGCNIMIHHFICTMTLQVACIKKSPFGKFQMIPRFYHIIYIIFTYMSPFS
jgi:hypothetical protein